MQSKVIQRESEGVSAKGKRKNLSDLQRHATTEFKKQFRSVLSDQKHVNNDLL